MFRTSFFWRVYGTLALLILAATALVGFLSDRWMARETLREIQRTLQAEARILGDLALPYLVETPPAPSAPPLNTDDFQGRVRRLGGEIGTRLTVIRQDGTVIADSQHDTATLENHATRPEIVAARESGLGTAKRYSVSIRDDMVYVAVPVYENGDIRGFARAALPVRRVNQRLLVIHRQVIAGALIAQALVLLIGFLIERRITRPLRTITEAAGTLVRGDYHRHVEVGSRDEIASLARSLNEIAGDVRERLEQSGRERSELLATLEEIAEGVIIVDREERVMQMNVAAGSILRADPAASRGRPVWEVIRHTKVTDIVDAALREHADTARMIGIPSTRGDIVVDLRATPLYSDDGAVSGAVLVFQDVTELARLERIRSDFTANVTHELKTPLTALRSLVETMREDPGMSASVRDDFMARIEDQTARLTRLVNDLLTLTRVESGEGGDKKTELDLRDPVLDAVRTLRPAGEKKGLEIGTGLAPAPILVIGDRAALRQVGENLLDNAIKYTATGGRIEVRVFADDGQAVIEVEDSGVGIDPDEQVRIFERFYRVDRARARDDERGGAGLGLSIVKRITLALGGDVSVRSRPGCGSIFSVRLPLAHDAR